MTSFLPFGIVLLAFLICRDVSLRGRQWAIQVAKIEDGVGDTKSIGRVGTIEDEDGDPELEGLGDMVMCKARVMAMIEDIWSGSGEDDADIKDRACKSMIVFHLEGETDKDNMEIVCTALTSIVLMTYAHGQESDLMTCEDAVEVGMRSVREIGNATNASRAVLSKLARFHGEMDFYNDFIKKIIGGLKFRRSEL